LGLASGAVVPSAVEFASSASVAVQADPVDSFVPGRPGGAATALAASAVALDQSALVAEFAGSSGLPGTAAHADLYGDR